MFLEWSGALKLSILRKEQMTKPAKDSMKELGKMK